MITNFYLLVDCDGVTFNTEDKAFANMRRRGIDFNDQMAITNAFATEDWYDLFEGGEINGSIAKLQKLKESHEFIDVEALSTFSLFNKKEYTSNELEAKYDNYALRLPGIKPIFVPCTMPKHISEQHRVKNSILVDNSLNNVLEWAKAGGPAVLFVRNLDECFPNHGKVIAPYTFGANQPYFIIDDLDELINVKKMLIDYQLKTTYFGDDETIKKVIDMPTEEFFLSPLFADFLATLKDEDKIDCYFDYDGVVVDIFAIAKSDINKRLQEIKKQDLENGIVRDAKDYFVEFKMRNGNPWDYVIDDYFINLDWNNLLERARVIDDAFQTISDIKGSDIFRTVAIASSRNTYQNEGIAKANSSNNYGITTLSIPKRIKKPHAIPAPNNILVDDSLSKVYDWLKANGIGVLFLEQHKFTIPSDERPYYIIGKHSDVLKVLYLENYLKKQKTNNDKKYTK